MKKTARITVVESRESLWGMQWQCKARSVMTLLPSPLKLTYLFIIVDSRLRASGFTVGLWSAHTTGREWWGRYLCCAILIKVIDMRMHKFSRTRMCEESWRHANCGCCSFSSLFFVASQWMNPHIYILSSAQAEKLDFDIFTRICWTSQPPTKWSLNCDHDLINFIQSSSSFVCCASVLSRGISDVSNGRTGDPQLSWAGFELTFPSFKFHSGELCWAAHSGGKKFKFPFISISSSLLCLSLLRLVPETVSSSLHMAVMGRAGGDSSQLSRVNIK